MKCDGCGGRGYRPPRKPNDWPIACAGCDSSGAFSIARMARGLARADRSDPYKHLTRRRLRRALERLHHGETVRSATAHAVLDAMAHAGLLDAAP